MHYLAVSGGLNDRTGDDGGAVQRGNQHVPIPGVDGVVPAESVSRV